MKCAYANCHAPRRVYNGKGRPSVYCDTHFRSVQSLNKLRAVRYATDVAARKERDRRIVEMIADPMSGTLRDIARAFGLETASAVHTIGAKAGVVRGPVQYPTGCDVPGCPNPHHANGLCDMHRQRREREQERCRIALAEWRKTRATRDDVILDALAAGFSDYEIESITGVARSTIRRIDGRAD